MSDNAKAKQRGTRPSTAYKAPTEGLSHIVFEYGERMKPGSFKTMMESMAEHMASTLKRGGPEASRAIRMAEPPEYKEPDEPTEDKVTRKENLRFDAEWKAWWDRKKCGKRIPGKYSRNCHPTVHLP